MLSDCRFSAPAAYSRFLAVTSRMGASGQYCDRRFPLSLARSGNAAIYAPL